MRGFPKSVLAAVMFLSAGLSASAATFNGVTYSESDAIAPGRWTSQFTKAKTYAYQNHVPLLVVWVNPGCGYCERFERNVMGSSSVVSWLKERGYVGVIAINTVTADADSANAFIGSVGKFPKCAVYWNPSSGSAIKQSFTGRGLSATAYMDKVDAKVGEYAGVTKKTYDLDIDYDSASGKVTGAGTYASGKRVSLRATPVKGRVFLGWYEDAERLSVSKSFTYQMPAKNMKLTAKFATSEADAAAVRAVINGMDLGRTAGRNATNLVCGVAVSWPVFASGLTSTTVAISGLPSGLKYSSKTGLVTGAPSRAQTKSVKVVAKTASGTKVTYALEISVTSLPVWAKGTFNGGGEDGLLSLTVSAAGKISGKYRSEGANWVLSAASYATYDAKSDAFLANVLQKRGKTVLTNQVLVTGNAEVLLGQATCDRFTGWWNGWKSAAFKSVAKAIDRATNVTWQVASPVPGTITLSFGSSGAVSAKGSFVVGKSARTGKDVAHSASCSTCLFRKDESGYVYVFVYFPKRDKVFEGYAECVKLNFDGKNIFF